MAEKRCLRKDILSTVSKAIDFALENNAQEMEITISVVAGELPGFNVNIDGLCLPPKNGDLSN